MRRLRPGTKGQHATSRPSKPLDVTWRVKACVFVCLCVCVCVRNYIYRPSPTDAMGIYVPEHPAPSRILRKLDLSARARARTHTHTRVQLKSKLQYTGTWSAAARQLNRQCYHPAVFFHHLRLVALSLPQRKIRHAFKNVTASIFHNYLKKKIADVWNCVRCNCRSRGVRVRMYVSESRWQTRQCLWAVQGTVLTLWLWLPLTADAELHYHKLCLTNRL